MNWHEIASWVVLMVLVSVGILSPVVGLGEQTNLAFVSWTVQLAIVEALRDAPLASSNVLLNPAVDHEANWLVEDLLVDYLLSRTESVTVGDLDSAANGLVLTYRTLEIGVSYPNVGRVGFLGPKRVRRVATVEILFRLTERIGGRVLWNRGIRREMDGWMARGALEEVESEKYPFLKAPLPSGSWERYVEPLVVTAVLGGLTYLFFSHR